MLTATGMFLDALEKWLRAVRADDFEKAREYAKSIVLHGDLLVIHPDFRRCVHNHYPDLDPKEALVQMCRFLACASDGRGRVLKAWVDENKPIDTLNDSMDR